MFVSSYNTYVQPTDSQKVNKQKDTKTASSFEKFTIATPQEPKTLKNIENTLVNKNFEKNVFRAKQEIFQQTNQTLTAFKGQNTLAHAKNAYMSNTKMFSLLKVPSSSLNQTPSLKDTLPREPYAIKERNLRHTMVNTYIANDNYYKITA